MNKKTKSRAVRRDQKARLYILFVNSKRIRSLQHLIFIELIFIK